MSHFYYWNSVEVKKLMKKSHVTNFDKILDILKKRLFISFVVKMFCFKFLIFNWSPPKSFKVGVDCSPFLKYYFLLHSIALNYKVLHRSTAKTVLKRNQLFSYNFGSLSLDSASVFFHHVRILQYCQFHGYQVRKSVFRVL